MSPMREHGELPHIILVRPQEEGNVGAVARAMANMGLESLVLVEPAVQLGATARAFAVGARAILDRRRHAPSLADALGPYRRVVGTTSARARRPEVPLLAPRELPAVLASDPAGTPTALVFGPEASGLTRDELALCSPLVNVPCAPVQPTLNLAQAVLIVSYELHLDRLAADGGRPSTRATAAPPASTAEIEGLFSHFDRLLSRVGFARDDTFHGVVRDLRQLAARSTATSREVTLLRGICRRIERAFEHRA